MACLANSFVTCQHPHFFVLFDVLESQIDFSIMQNRGKGGGGTGVVTHEHIWEARCLCASARVELTLDFSGCKNLSINRSLRPHARTLTFLIYIFALLPHSTLIRQINGNHCDDCIGAVGDRTVGGDAAAYQCSCCYCVRFASQLSIAADRCAGVTKWSRWGDGGITTCVTTTYDAAVARDV